MSVCPKLASNTPLNDEDDDDDGLIDMLAISSMMPAQTNATGIGSLLNGVSLGTDVSDDYQEADASLAKSLAKASCFDAADNSLSRSFNNFNLSYADVVSNSAQSNRSRSTTPSMNGCLMGDLTIPSSTSSLLDHQYGAGDMTLGGGRSQQNECGLCKSSLIGGGKTLAGCPHSFCQSCLIELTSSSLHSSSAGGTATRIITCPICAQDSLMPLDDLGDLMPCFSNSMQLQLGALVSNANGNNHNNHNNQNNNNFSSNSSTSTSSPAAVSQSSSLSSISAKAFSQLAAPVCKICSNNGKSGVEAESSALAVVKCHDCNCNLCLNCLGQHKSLPNCYNHRLEYITNLHDAATLLFHSKHGANTRFGGSNQSANYQNLKNDFSPFNKMGNGNGYHADPSSALLAHLHSNLFGEDFNISNIDYMNSNNLAKKLQQQQYTHQVHKCIQQHRAKLENDINQVFNVYLQAIKERRDNLMKELRTHYEAGLNNLGSNKQQNGRSTEKGEDSNEVSENMLCQLSHLLSVEFIYNLNSVQSTVVNSFGFLKANQQNKPYKPRPIGPVASSANTNVLGHSAYAHFTPGFDGFTSQTGQNLIKNPFQFNRIESPIISANSGKTVNGGYNLAENGNKNSSGAGSSTGATSWSSVVANRTQNAGNGQNGSSEACRNNSSNDTPPVSASSTSSASSSSSTGLSPNNDLMIGSNEASLANGYSHDFDGLSLRSNSISNTHDDLSTPVSVSQHSTQQLPARSQLKRAKMTYSCKFGEFGVADGLFTEPSGVAINANNDIIVADTNSHRIQIFDKDGKFKFKFGTCGKREGQLLYPNRVAVFRQTGDIVVTERSPTHQIQVYNQFGQFLRKFGSNILQHPRGVCVDSKGRIIVVECKVMRVIIFDLMGNVLQKFNCSKYLEFPNGCCCSNDREEIFISDNRAHSIKVFNYDGQFLRQIGGEGITNYPIGVGINSNGEVLVADNHNNFNLTVFTQDGQRINALESKVKHAQCFDVALMDDGSIVLASKDYRIYVYKYNAGPAAGSEDSSSNCDSMGTTLTSRSSGNNLQSNGSYSDQSASNSNNILNNNNNSFQNSLF